MHNQRDPNPYRILVVDDNPSIHEDFRKILCPAQSQNETAVASLAEEILGDAPAPHSRGRFSMESAFQGRAALALVQTAEREGRPYSLAFVDVRMPPGWDGIETIRQIWKDFPHIQVVICTAYSDYSLDHILLHLGETDNLIFLKKPFDNVEVLQLAHTLTRKWALTRQASARMADLDDTVRQRTCALLAANGRLQVEIEQRSRVEAALRESEERFRLAFDAVALPLSISYLDARGYLDVNRSFAELCGYPKAELLGQTPASLNLAAEPEGYAQLVQQLERGKPVRHAELKLRRKDGQVRTTLASLAPFTLRGQACLLAALLDVTDQRRLDAQLRQTDKMEAVGQLAAGVAHDFNNLLTIIHGYTSLQLAKTTLEADIAKAFSQVKMASERAATLTRQLLAFSRQQIVQRKPLDLAAFLDNSKDVLASILGETIQLECRLAPRLPPIQADTANLDQVLMNLVVNARDAMPSGGKLLLATEAITLSAEAAAGHLEARPGPFVVLSVTDTGCGMDAATLNRIFEPFFTTKPIGRGTGLGLSTVYGILKQHEGWIEVESQPGQGTSFRLFFPAVEGAAPSVAPPTEKSSPSLAQGAGPGAILVVEDQPDVRDFVTAALSGQGYEILQAQSGAEALLKWKEVGHRVRLVLTDLVMPHGVSGTALTKHLLRRKPDLRIIYTSGHSLDTLSDTCPLTEGVNFLAKPFTHQRLLAAVQNALKPPPPTDPAAGAVQPGRPRVCCLESAAA